MFYYRVTHFFITRKPEHFHGFDIGIYDSIEKAHAAIELLKTKPGFSFVPMHLKFEGSFASSGLVF